MVLERKGRESGKGKNVSRVTREVERGIKKKASLKL